MYYTKKKGMKYAAHQLLFSYLLMKMYTNINKYYTSCESEQLPWINKWNRLNPMLFLILQILGGFWKLLSGYKKSKR